MKSLQDFKTLVEEEKSDYSKFDMLVRAGLANKAQIQRIHKILDKMQEEKPVFNNADRMILQNLFNKMVDLISNNKQILSQAKRAVREDVEVEEAVLDTSDFKVGPSGKKVKAHRFTVGDTVKEDIEIEEATMDIPDAAATTRPGAEGCRLALHLPSARVEGGVQRRALTFALLRGAWRRLPLGVGPRRQVHRPPHRGHRQQLCVRWRLVHGSATAPAARQCVAFLRQGGLGR